MTHETTAPVQSLVDEILADLDRAEKTHLDGEVRDIARDAVRLIREQRAELARRADPVAVPDENGLLPCPFCGGNAELHQRETESLWSHNQVTWSQVGCHECECVGADCCEDYDGSEAVAHWNTRATIAAPTPPAQQPDAQATLDRICDLFRIGRDARTPAAILANVENTKRFADQLRAVEVEFFTVPGEPDKDEPDAEPQPECLLNSFGSTPEQYVEQFRAALAKIAPPAQQSQADGRREGIEAAARMIEKQATDYAMEFGHDDLGALSFGAGPYAEAKHDHYNTLCELAEEVRAMLAAPGDTAAPEQAEQDAVTVPRELLEDALFEADNLLDEVNGLLQYAGSTGEDKTHGEGIKKLRALLGGGA